MHDHHTRTAKIVGLGTSLPARVLTNADFERMVETSDEWIVTRTGIRERRVVGPGESLATLAVEAGQKALADAGVDPREVELVILATATPEQPIPATSAIIQPLLGATRAVCFDLSAACSGFVYALQVARQFFSTGEVSTALVIGAETLSRYVDYTDRATCVLFGDGAGAVVLKAAPAGEGILRVAWHTDGTFADFICMPGGGSRFPPNVKEHVDARLPFIKMRGNETFKVAVRSLAEVCEEVLTGAGVKVEDIDLLVPHQANIRIIDAVASRLGVPAEKVFVNVDRVGNTSAASIPLALADARAQGRLKPGDLVLMAAFGGGLTWAASLLRW
ncbi:MAG: ketoacyl-ACP synthase III [Thermoanaerobaculum sp.]|nr:ketoacyl-ACP synthase III [Thermoanaerobaculum sp.]MDW7968006.1 beta-ketoacyl-ACP synthase III [Thermoanaerobaculum sp.]